VARFRKDSAFSPGAAAEEAAAVALEPAAVAPVEAVAVVAAARMKTESQIKMQQEPWQRKAEQLAGGHACETSSMKGSFPLCAYPSETFPQEAGFHGRLLGPQPKFLF